MSARVTRNVVVEMLGTPDRTAGSLNSPVQIEESVFRFNEKWTYEHLVSDPAGAPQRTIFWQRYDFVATMVRGSANEEWRPDTRLAEAVAATEDRLPPLEGNHKSTTPSGRYSPASEVEDATDLGGYIMGRRPPGSTNWPVS